MPGVRSIALGFWIGAGSRDEPDARAGVSHFIEHLLFKGSSRYSAQEIAEIFDELGGELNAATSRETTVVYARIPDDGLERALDVMADMVFRPTFADVDSEREVVLEEIAMVEDTPNDLVHDIAAEAVFGAHPLGRPVIGRADVISSVSRRALAGYHRRAYRARRSCSQPPGTSATTSSSRCSPSAAEPATGAGPARRAETGSRDGCARRPLPAQGHGAVPRLPERARHLASRRARFAASLMDAIVGGSASSRLFQEIREKRGMAYSVYSYSSQYADAGQIGVYVGTREDNLAECLEIAVAELTDIAARQRARRRARAREGEPQGAHPALARVDVGAHDAARKVHDHGHAAAHARGDREAARGVTAARGRRARGRAPRTGAPVRRRDRSGRGVVRRRRVER